MPFLPDEHSADKLLKNLGIHLGEHFSGYDLNQLNWYQFRDYDHPKTLVSTELAVTAFLYLGFDPSGTWKRCPSLIAAIIPFMARYYRDRPQKQDLIRLKQLIEAQPCDRQAVADWFHAIYPPDSAPE